jgi:hypothetical protein
MSIETTPPVVFFGLFSQITPLLRQLLGIAL